jgi:hypothetical protein
MSLLFESILLFSLAVLIILVGMLVYYFKKRIVDIEQKNAKCFEIVQDVYMQQMQLKKDVFAVLFREQEAVFTQTQHLEGGVNERTLNERTLNERTLNERTLNERTLNEHSVKDRIHVELSESEDESDESDDDESDDDESDDDEDNESSRDESSPKIKIVNVDLSYPEECDISIDEESESEDEIIDEPESEIVSLNNQETIVVNKVEDTRKSVSKEDLQKMSPASLKSLLISKGVPAETVNKLKKKELVDMLL